MKKSNRKPVIPRVFIRRAAKEKGWLDTSPTVTKGKEGIVYNYTWRITKTKVLTSREIGQTKADSKIYLLARRELGLG